jgi:two-component system OmpR family sensor kinase
MTPTAVRSPGRFSVRGRSLRYQIVVLLLALLLVSFLAVAAATALALRGFLIQRLDQQLVAAGDRFSVSLEHPDDHDADNSAQFATVAGQAAGTLGARVLRGTVTAVEVVAHDDDDQAAVSGKDKAVLAALRPSSHPRTVHLPDLGEYRVTVLAGDDGDVLITGLPEHPVDDTIARLLLIEASVFAIALLVTGSVGALSVRLSLRPLHRVASTARQVSSLALSAGTVSLPERVPVPAPQTEAGQVADAFNHMLEHVEAALHDRNASEDRLRHFIADASHELRTPITVVRSYVEYAQRVGGELPEPVHEALARIGSESDRMGHLVEDLLLLARLDSGRPLVHEPVDVTHLVLDAVSDARVTAGDYVWRLELPEQELLVEGDSRSLHQVLANLLGNARSHTPPGTTITTAVTAEDEADRVVITVSDDGPGIPDDTLPRVFDRFVRADTARAHGDGSGLGLSIVAAIVAAHHGTAAAASIPGRTTFTITLPRSESTHSAPLDDGTSLP